jgi:CBS domain-containing protein
LIHFHNPKWKGCLFSDWRWPLWFESACPQYERIQTPLPPLELDATVSEIVNIMTEKNIHRLPITKEGKLVAIVARPDILKSQINPSIFVL